MHCPKCNGFGGDYDDAFTRFIPCEYCLGAGYEDDFDDGHERYGEEQSMYHNDYDLDFQDPGGNSALRRATRDNPRVLPCPTCKRPNQLTPADRRRGYQCDRCADMAEGLIPNAYY